MSSRSKLCYAGRVQQREECSVRCKDDAREEPNRPNVHRRKVLVVREPVEGVPRSDWRNSKSLSGDVIGELFWVLPPRRSRHAGCSGCERRRYCTQERKLRYEEKPVEVVAVG